MCDLFEAGVGQTPSVRAALSAGEQDALNHRPLSAGYEQCEALAYRHAYGTTAFHMVKAAMLATAIVHH